MYKHNKRGNAVIVDPAAGKQAINPSQGQIVNIGTVAGAIKPEYSRTFEQGTSTVSLGFNTTFGVGACLPPINTSANIALTISAVAHWRADSDDDRDNWITAMPFVALTTLPIGNLTVEDNSKMYIPPCVKHTSYMAINKTVIVKDCGYGLDLKTKGLTVGIEWRNTLSATAVVRCVSGSLYTRYNYAPITLLDQEN